MNVANHMRAKWKLVEALLDNRHPLHTHNPSSPTLVSFGGGLPVLGADHRQAHLALLVDVGVVDLCLECDLGRLEGVLGGEDYFDSERAFVIRRIVLEVEEKGKKHRSSEADGQLRGGGGGGAATHRNDEPLPCQQV